MRLIKSLPTVVLTFTIWTMTQAQSPEGLHKVWTFYEFKPIGEGGIMIAGIESFKLIEFKNNDVLLLNGSPDKIDSINYRVDGTMIVLFDKENHLNLTTNNEWIFKSKS